MRLFFLLLCCAVMVFAGCSHTGRTAPSSNTEIEQAPTAPTLIIAAKEGRTYGVIRLSADSKSPILAKLPVGTEMKSFGQFEDWYQVQIPDTGQLGWINDVFLEEKP
jgi:photosystem II stability/assembly factor-like uncharacterized protein